MRLWTLYFSYCNLNLVGLDLEESVYASRWLKQWREFEVRTTRLWAVSCLELDLELEGVSEYLFLCTKSAPDFKLNPIQRQTNTNANSAERPYKFIDVGRRVSGSGSGGVKIQIKRECVELEVEVDPTRPNSIKSASRCGWRDRPTWSFIDVGSGSGGVYVVLHLSTWYRVGDVVLDRINCMHAKIVPTWGTGVCMVYRKMSVAVGKKMHMSHDGQEEVFQRRESKLGTARMFEWNGSKG
ncbi:hypothetical protein K438DRAFT_1775286 [Mycena galopus ATCC 62051]|nr:hypothetical protein K438DRAFT_1775286 [Mycena galopus ATCC 62051]